MWNAENVHCKRRAKCCPPDVCMTSMVDRIVFGSVYMCDKIVKHASILSSPIAKECVFLYKCVLSRDLQCYCSSSSMPNNRRHVVNETMTTTTSSLLYVAVRHNV